MSWSFSAKAGSVESLKLRQRCGARPCAFQMLWIVETARPQAAAIARAVQCVASCAGGASVRRTTSSTRAASIGALPGGRVLSCNSPSTPATMNRSCQRQTVVFDLPVAAMMPFVPEPSAVRRMIRARQTCFCGVLRSATTASRRRRSAAETEMKIPRRMPQTRTRHRRRESRLGLFRFGKTTRSSRDSVD
jgi:hypothetical protein